MHSAANGNDEAQGAGFADNVTLLRPTLPYEAVLPPQPDEATYALIVRLRDLLQLSLLRPREDLDKACMFIANDANVSAELYAAAFFHGLETYGKRRLRFFTTRSREVSVDEMWMARLLNALYTGNVLNSRYLLSLRIEQIGHRRLGFLAAGLAQALLGKLDLTTRQTED
jgi:hypothetical protein